MSVFWILWLVFCAFLFFFVLIEGGEYYDVYVQMCLFADDYILHIIFVFGGLFLLKVIFGISFFDLLSMVFSLATSFPYGIAVIIAVLCVSSYKFQIIYENIFIISIVTGILYLGIQLLKFQRHFARFMSLTHVLRELHEVFGIKPIRELSTLTVHLVASINILDIEPWDIFMEEYPKIKQLNLIFVVKGHNIEDTRHTDTYRLKKSAGRYVNVSMKQMLYHLYYSSPDYAEPDVVIIFDNRDQMLATKEDVLHSEMSYRNMISSRRTVLVLMDKSKKWLNKGVKAVNDTQMADTLAGPCYVGLLCGYYFTCLRRKRIAA